MPAKAGISSAGRYSLRNAPRRLDLYHDQPPRGVLYVGVTADLVLRIAPHRDGAGSALCRRYNPTRLVHAEERNTIQEAIAREKALKAGRRD